MTTVYTIAHDGSFGKLRITTHADRRDAVTHVSQLGLRRTDYVTAAEPADLPPASVGTALRLLSDALGISGDAPLTREGVFQVVVAEYHDQPHEVIAPPPPATPIRGVKDQTMDNQPASQAKKAKGAAKAPKAASPRGKGKPAGKVADFKQVKIGSARERILSLMDGSKTAEQIGKAVGVDAAKVGAHAFCLARDCGVGYAYGEGGTLKALFPAGKTLKDALRSSEPAKPAKKAAAAKPAAKAKAKAARPAAKPKGADAGAGAAA